MVDEQSTQVPEQSTHIPEQNTQVPSEEELPRDRMMPPRERYETVSVETVNYGTNNFIEIAKKKAPNGNLFISVSKGWYPQGSTEKRYSKGIGFPLEAELVDRIFNAFTAIAKQ